MRRVVALAIGLVLSTLLLGGGWLFSTLRERELSLREARGRLIRAADVVRGAVDESLEELRRREDQRPFYLYNHFYSPPDVLALSDPVAVSPLARPPEDERLVGHFQIEPGGQVRTPYTADASSPPPLAVRVRSTLEREPFAPIRQLASGEGGGLMLPDFTGAVRSDDLGLLDRMEDPDEPEREALLDMNTWGSNQAQDIQAAQAGDAVANARVIERGRRVPRISRRDVPWQHYGVEPPDNAPSVPQGSGSSTGSSTGALDQIAEPSPGADLSGPTPAARSALDNMVRREAEVEYAPMAFRELDGELVLHRVVSHGELRIVQGALLDEPHLVEAWLPSVVARHTSPDARPRVVRSGDGDCAVRRPASAILSDAELCFAPAALAAATGAMDSDLRYQIGALVALWLIALLAAAAIVASARRAEALSRQKSAFVSAVSHELRTPLTTLRMHAEMLDEGMVTEQRRPKVHRELVRESVRLARLVDNVLSLSKLEEGRRRLRRTEGDLAAHVREVVEDQRRLVEERGFTLTAPSRDALSAVFDAQAVEQIVVNLIDNALKYADGETRAIEVWVGQIDGAPAIAVRDRGPGIPVADRERVFERFHRVEREQTAHAPGTGIGLSLVAELAEAHGGRAMVLPRDGGGVEIRVTLGR